MGESPESISDFTYVTNKIAYFPETLEICLSKEIPDYCSLVTRAHTILGSNVGKPLIARYIARELIGRTPPFIPPSIKSIIKNIIDIKWNGSCLLK